MRALDGLQITDETATLISKFEITILPCIALLSTNVHQYNSNYKSLALNYRFLKKKHIWSRKQTQSQSLKISKNLQIYLCLTICFLVDYSRYLFLDGYLILLLASAELNIVTQGFRKLPGYITSKIWKVLNFVPALEWSLLGFLVFVLSKHITTFNYHILHPMTKDQQHSLQH